MSLRSSSSGMGIARRRAWRFVWFVLASICLALLVGGLHLRTQLPTVDIDVRMSTTTAGKGQFFPLTPAGYTEPGSTRFRLISDGRFHSYPARLQVFAAQAAFRVDPGSGSGRVAVDSIQVRSGHHSVQLVGDHLRNALRKLNQLEPANGPGPIEFLSTGTDPYFEAAIPPEVFARSWTSRSERVLLAMGGALGLLLLFAARTRLISIAIRQKTAIVHSLAIAIGGVLLLAMLQGGCDGLCSAKGITYGSALMAAALLLAVMGAAIVQLMGLGGAWAKPRLFLWVIVGQLALVLFVFVRSAVHAAIPLLPMQPLEIVLPIIAAAIYLALTRQRSTTRMPSRQVAWGSMEIALLAVVCLVIADRELPRLVMLSSDPDTHAFLARQLDLLGGIPWLGEQQFRYPAGTAAIGFVWGKLSFLAVRNAITALPLLQSYLAALVLAEALSSRVRANSARMVMLLTALGVTAAGFLVPVYINYGHMEGTGRQMAIATAALVPALLLANWQHSHRMDRPLAAMVLCTLFVLAALNPINVVLPAILVIGYSIYFAVARRRISWWLAGLLACPVLLLLDPYYFHLLTGLSPPVPKITITDALGAMPASEILSSWLGNTDWEIGRYLKESARFGFGQTVPMFGAFLVAGLLIGLSIGQKPKSGWAAVAAIGAGLIGSALASSLFAVLQDDRRFYLLAPYYAFTTGQFKILLITAMTGVVLLIGATKRWRLPVLALAGVAMVLAVRAGMNSAQRFALAPRAAYCGSLGCVSRDDLAVLQRFEQTIRALGPDRSHSQRVLVPNSVHDTRREGWIFPVSGSRALPFYDVAPAAFYYYQGDDDYTTENYKVHVCHHFDREWLKRQNIGYVFLPSNRNAACLQGMEDLPLTEIVVAHSGDSYLLKLR